jgi:hypothetical protein
MFVVLGLGALGVAIVYPVGRLAQMGPGFFPIALAVTLTLLGAAVCAGGLARGAAPDADDGPLVGPAARPLLFVTLGLVAFAVLVRPLGLVPATVALVLIASRADRGFPWALAVPLSLALAAVATAIFVYGLGLPFRVWP